MSAIGLLVYVSFATLAAFVLLVVAGKESGQDHPAQTAAKNEPNDFDYDAKTIDESVIRLSAIYSTTKDQSFDKISDLFASDFYTSPANLNKHDSTDDYNDNLIPTNHDGISAMDSEGTKSSEIRITKREIGDELGVGLPTGEHILSNNDLETPATNFDEVFASTNDVTSGELHNKIQPTKTTGNDNGIGLISTSTDHHVLFSPSGEGQRASVKGRSFPLPKPDTVPERVARTMSNTTHNTSTRSDDRKTNPDIQDIITGFVKLLNGNVQVQVNPHPNLPVNSRPQYPVRTRINNRGPPRITDVPPIEFDSPLPPPSFVVPPSPPSSTRIPPPYPFDIPPSISSLPQQPTNSVLRPFLSGVPLPEEIVHVGSKIPGNKTPDQSAQATRLSAKLKPNAPKKPLENKPEINSSVITKPSVQSTEAFQPLHSAEPTKVTPLTIASSKINGTLTFLNTTKEPITTSSTNFQNNSAIVSSTPSTATSTTILNIDISSSITTKDNVIKFNSSTLKTEETQTTSTIEPSKVVKPFQTSTEAALPPTSTVVSTFGTTVVGTVLESSIQEVSSQETNKPTGWDSSTSSLRPQIQTAGDTTFPYYPRPGIVLDDPEYKPGDAFRHRPILTAPPPRPGGEIFDVTVSAVQGPGGANTGQPFVYPVEIEGVEVGGGGTGEVSVITTAEAGQHFVSIDGKRTYINLFGSSQPSQPPVTPTTAQRQPPVKATAGTYSVGQPPLSGARPTQGHKHTSLHRRPLHPPVRIDTCIVGDDSTCDAAQNERCRTEVGVSSCHCRPGYSRRKHRDPCHRIVSMVMSLRVDRLYEQKLLWNNKLNNKNSPEYLELEYEASNAIDSAMSMTPFSDEFLGCHVNSIYTSLPSSTPDNKGPVFVNLTLQLEENGETLRPAVKHDIQRHLLGVIHRRGNNVGASALWVDNPPGSVSQIQDLDECSGSELHDCHLVATCSNTFGSFKCSCPDGYRDPWAGNPHRSGRECHTCPPEHCNHRGECRYQNDQPVCKCAGSYYGAQCEIDGEVLGVAIGASVVAVIIIISTLICLCMWSRRWSREQKVAAGMGSPVFGYMATGASTVKTPGVGAPPYQVSLEDRLRWAQIADVMAQATNHYAPEPVGTQTRPSSAMFGYNGTLPHLAAPIPLPRLGLRPASVHGMRLPDSSSSEEEDRADLLGRNFHVPRPKSRSSVANQSGIYYDVDYEKQGDIFAPNKQHPGCIPMSTYTMRRSHYYRT